MLIFKNGLRIIFDDGLKRNTGIINSQVSSVEGNSRYLVDVYDSGIISERQVVLECQILKVYIKDIYGLDIWVKIDDLYSSYPNGKIIGPDTVYKHSVDGRRSGRYPWGELASRYIKNDEEAVKAAIRDWKITPKKVIFNGPATIVIWQDGTKTIVKRREGEEDDREKAVMYAILKKLCGNKAGMDRYLKSFFKEVESNEEKKEEAGSSELHWEK